MRKKNGRTITIKVLTYIFLILLTLFIIIPLVWMIMGSFKDTTEIFRHAEHLLPQSFHLGNYIKGWKGFANVSFTVFFKNSLIISGLATVGAVCSSAIIAYGFARCNFKGKGIWFSAMLVSMMLPFQIIMIPQYILFNPVSYTHLTLPTICSV